MCQLSVFNNLFFLTFFLGLLNYWVTKFQGSIWDLSHDPITILRNKGWEGICLSNLGIIQFCVKIPGGTRLWILSAWWNNHSWKGIAIHPAKGINPHWLKTPMQLKSLDQSGQLPLVCMRQELKSFLTETIQNAGLTWQ